MSISVVYLNIKKNRMLHLDSYKINYILFEKFL